MGEISPDAIAKSKASIFERNRLSSYTLLSVVLILAFLWLHGSTWQGDPYLHTLMELVAMILAMMVGVIGLVRYYTTPKSSILLLGAGFIGTALLDGYHALITSPYFVGLLPSEIESLSPWSWLASRMFLSIVLLMVCRAAHREAENFEDNPHSALYIYSLISVLVAFTFLFFGAVPLSRGYFPELASSRPEDFIPGIFFGAALYGFLKYGNWRHDIATHWLILALIISLVNQIMFIPFSAELFDANFNTAHLLKILSYLCVLTGLFIGTFQSFRNEQKLSLQSNRELAKRLLETQRFETIFNASPSGLIIVRADGQIDMANARVEQVLGFDQGTLEGNLIENLVPEVYRDQHQIERNKFARHPEQRVMGNGTVLQAQCYDGRKIPVEIGLTPIETDRGPMVIASLTDLSEVEQAKRTLEKHTEALQRSNDELNQFAYVASHDLRAPLRGISKLAEIIEQDAGDVLDDESLHHLGLMRNRVERLNRLLSDLLQYSRVGSNESKAEFVDMHQVINGAKELYLADTGFDLCIEGKLPEIYAPKALVEQVLRNLIMNSVKHHDRDHGTISIWAGVDASYEHLYFADDGPGIPTQYHEKVFQLFQTLKRRDEVEGSGMGLAIIKKAMIACDGMVSVESGDERGAKFCLSFPRNIYSL